MSIKAATNKVVQADATAMDAEMRARIGEECDRAMFARASPEEIRMLRTRMRLTQAELAAELGVNEYAVSRWEHRLKKDDPQRKRIAGEPVRSISEAHTVALRNLARERLGYFSD